VEKNLERSQDTVRGTHGYPPHLFDVFFTLLFHINIKLCFPPVLRVSRFPFLQIWYLKSIMGYKITNIYVITTVAVIGGALFGFDIASMSAMYVLI
jgi:hypothetical protein